MANAWFETPRPVAKRLAVTGTLELVSPARTGGTDSLDLTDRPLLRDHKGMPFLPGTTLAGLLRSYLNDLTGGGNKGSGETALLFGCRWGKDDEEQSPLIVDDAFLDPEQNGESEIRDNVRINPGTGVAQKGMKFDGELLPKGTRFQIGFELLLPEDNSKESELISLLVTVLKGLEKKKISIGGRTRRGLGRCKAAAWKYRIFDLSNKEGMLAWIGAGGGVSAGWPDVPEAPLNKSIAELANVLSVSAIRADKEVRDMTISIKAVCPASFLTRAYGYSPDGADAESLHRLKKVGSSQKEPVISGESLAGALRHRALKIAATLQGNPENTKVRNLVDNLFGRDMSKEVKEPSASRVWTRESVLEGPKTLRHTRISIDSWRGSAMKHMLIEEDALFASNVELKWHIEKPEEHEIGLMLCLVKDLFTGDLPLGGETGIGRGIFYGISASIAIPSQSGEKHVVSLEGDGKGGLKVAEGSTETQDYFNALREYLKGQEK